MNEITWKVGNSIRKIEKNSSNFWVNESMRILLLVPLLTSQFTHKYENAHYHNKLGKTAQNHHENE